jgi:hypothetical protein
MSALALTDTDIVITVQPTPEGQVRLQVTREDRTDDPVHLDASEVDDLIAVLTYARQRAVA